MTAEEIRLESDYRLQERLGILAQGAEPTPTQMRLAREEVTAWEHEAQVDDQLNTSLANIQRLVERNRRDTWAKKRFLTKPRICSACDCVIDENGCGCNPPGV